jgi:hypothetical protein
MTLPTSSRYIEAEVAAWPLWSEEAFHGCVLRLERTEEGVLKEPTRRLTDSLLHYLRPRSRGLSLEQLRQFQEHVWFNPRETRNTSRVRTVSLEEHLSAISTRNLVSYGGHFFVRDGATPLELQVADWRWLSLTLPPDLVIAAHAAAEGSSMPGCDHVSLGAEHLAHFFREGGIAQTHLHLGSAIPFELLWTNLMTRVPTDAFTPHVLQDASHTPFGSGANFLGWLVTAALARLCLASFLWHEPTEDFWHFQERLARRNNDVRVHLAALASLADGKKPVPPFALKPVLRRLAGPPPERLPRGLDEVRQADPLYAWFRQREGALPETLFLYQCLRWLRTRRLEARRRPTSPGAAGEELFAKLFWQYVRIRNRTYRHLVQEPGTAGLDWFTTHFRRIWSVRQGLEDGLRMSSALRMESRGPAALASLEVRSSPPGSSAEVVRLVRQVAEAEAPADVHPERGLVLHFVKELARDQGRGRPHADPRSLAHGCRFGAYFHECAKQARAISAALRRSPELLVVLRGLDVCNLELAVPSWVFAPLFERLRRSSEAASDALARHGSRIPPFRFTMHVGEDYRRLIEGLRRIDEPIRFRLLQPGDRLGHAVALGVDPARWAASAPITRQPAEERLDDLLWEMDLYRTGGIPVHGARVERVRKELDELSLRIYGRHEKLEDLVRARELRHEPAFLLRLGYPFLEALARRTIPRRLRPEWLVHRYLTDFEVYSRGQAAVEVQANEEEVQVLRDVQRYLRNLVARRSMTVEANPSSNMLIGDLPLEEHPVFALQPLPGMRRPEGDPVLVSIGDDDPLTFASTLPDEFCHLYYALIRRGISSSDTLSWLQQIRSNGMRARFTVPDYSVAPDLRRSGRLQKGT